MVYACTLGVLTANEKSALNARYDAPLFIGGRYTSVNTTVIMH